jgi:hypothetical protein
MSQLAALLLTASLAGLTASVGYVHLVRRRPRRFGPVTALAMLTVLVSLTAFPEEVEAKGAVGETLAVVFCYAAMVLGMVAQYGYQQAERHEFTFDPAAFFMPIFASPIVFIPLLTVITDVSISGALSKPKLMVYLVAFQNGFFWKGFFEGSRLKAQGLAPHKEHSNDPLEAGGSRLGA